tara:strand:- start:6046 stop:7626 length:1581 start_codon:yes stop_codon:yes gene_type:complete
MNTILWKDKALELKDGINLISRFWYPKEGDCWPVLFMRQPYGREIASTITYSHPTWWADKGFLVVIQDVRGQGGSGGSFNGFSQEPGDTKESINWLRSLPECNGKVGLYGFSYQGITQLLVEEGCDPPDCLSPAMTGLNNKDFWCSDGNAFWWQINISWGLQLACMKLKRQKRFKEWVNIRKTLEDESYLREGLDLLKEYDPNNIILKWLEYSNKEIKLKNIEPLKSWLKKPILLIGGLWDPHLRGTIDIYKKSILAGGEPEIYIGPSSHLNWAEETNDILLDFFEKHLKRNKSNKAKFFPKRKIWNITTNKWEKINNLSNKNEYWSLSSSINRNSSSLISTGILRKDKPGKGLITIVSDPWRPVPSIGGHLSYKDSGICNRINIDKRNDIAKFDSTKNSENHSIQGIPELMIKASADKLTFDICIALSIINPTNSKVLQISTGFLRVKNQNILEEKMLNIKLQPINFILKKDWIMRLSIAGTSWPAIGVNSGKLNIEAGPPSGEHEIITINLILNESNFFVSPIF